MATTSTPRYPYDPGMHLAYDDDTPAVETSLTIRDPDTGRERGTTFDNATNVFWFLAAYDLRPVEEKLDKKNVDEFLLPNGEHELPGLAGTAIDGTTSQNLLDGIRARSGPYYLDIVVHGDPDLMDVFEGR